MPVQRPYNPNARRIAELMQADLAKVGVKAEIKSFEWGEYRKRAQDGEHQMAELGWTGDNGDPDNFLHVLLGCDAAGPGGSNIAKWCYKPFDDLVVAAKRITDIAKRTELYQQAQDDLQGRGAVVHDRPFDPIQAGAQRGGGLQAEPASAPTDFYGVDLKSLTAAKRRSPDLSAYAAVPPHPGQPRRPDICRD